MPYCLLMDALAKAGRIQDAKLVFDEMKEKSIRSGIFQLYRRLILRVKLFCYFDMHIDIIIFDIQYTKSLSTNGIICLQTYVWLMNHAKDAVYLFFLYTWC